MKPYPPLGLLYISSHLKARGVAADMFDTTFARFDDLRGAPPTRAAAGGRRLQQPDDPLEVLQVIAAAEAVGSIVVVGGPDPANYLEEYLSRGADVIVIGEGELTLEELVPHLAGTACRAGADPGHRLPRRRRRDRAHRAAADDRRPGRPALPRSRRHRSARVRQHLARAPRPWAPSR